MNDETAPLRPTHDDAASARARLRDRTVGLRGLVAVALAGLVLGVPQGSAPASG